MCIKFLSEPAKIIKSVEKIIHKILGTELKTEAGRNNLFFGFLLFILLLLLLVPDYLISFANYTLSMFGKSQLPQFPNGIIAAFLFLVLFLFAWSVWYVGKIEEGIKS